MQEDETRIFIVDDHPLMRLSLIRLLSDAGHIVAGEACGISEALVKIHYTRPNILIVDISLGNDSGYDLLKEVRLYFPRVRVIVYTMHDAAIYAALALKSGAVGFVTKSEPAEALLKIIHDVINDKVSVRSKENSIKGSIYEGTASMPQMVVVKTLTHRQLEVYQLLGQGFTAREISKEMHISIKTVHTYVLRIKEKLNLLNTAELVRSAMIYSK